jgi:hypothetical protein
VVVVVPSAAVELTLTIIALYVLAAAWGLLTRAVDD